MLDICVYRDEEGSAAGRLWRSGVERVHDRLLGLLRLDLELDALFEDEATDGWLALPERYALVSRYVAWEPAGRPADSCPICLDDMDCDLSKLQCGHKFHRACLFQWLEGHLTCPKCRRELQQMRPC